MCEPHNEVYHTPRCPTWFMVMRSWMMRSWVTLMEYAHERTHKQLVDVKVYSGLTAVGTNSLLIQHCDWSRSNLFCASRLGSSFYISVLSHCPLSHITHITMLQLPNGRTLERDLQQTRSWVMRSLVTISWVMRSQVPRSGDDEFMAILCRLPETIKYKISTVQGDT